MENFYAQKQLIKAEWGQLYYYYRKNYCLMALATNFKDIFTNLSKKHFPYFLFYNYETYILVPYLAYFL